MVIFLIARNRFWSKFWWSLVGLIFCRVLQTVRPRVRMSATQPSVSLYVSNLNYSQVPKEGASRRAVVAASERHGLAP